MTAVLRGNLALACAQVKFTSHSYKLMHGCRNISSDDKTRDNNSSEFSNMMLFQPFISSLGNTGDLMFGFCLLCVILCAIAMNCHVICSFAVRQQIVVSVDYYILTLAISDLCSPVFAYPLAMFSAFSHHWLFGDTGCVINGFLGFFFGIVDIFVLSVLSITRCLCICHPVIYNRMTKGHVMLSILGVILMSALWAGLPLLGWGNYAVEPFGTSCTLDWSTPDRSYVTCVFGSCLLLPLFVMTVSYGRILHTSTTASRRLRKYSESHIGRRRNRQDMKLIKLTVLMTLSFLLAWLPYAVVSMMSAYLPGVKITGPVSVAPTLLAKTSHLSSPIIYFFMNSRYSPSFLCWMLPNTSRHDRNTTSPDFSITSKNGPENVKLGYVRGRGHQCRQMGNTLTVTDMIEDCSLVSSTRSLTVPGKSQTTSSEFNKHST